MRFVVASFRHKSNDILFEFQSSNDESDFDNEENIKSNKDDGNNVTCDNALNGCKYSIYEDVNMSSTIQKKMLTHGTCPILKHIDLVLGNGTQRLTQTTRQLLGVNSCALVKEFKNKK